MVLRVVRDDTLITEIVRLALDLGPGLKELRVTPVRESCSITFRMSGTVGIVRRLGAQIQRITEAQLISLEHRMGPASPLAAKPAPGACDL